MVVYGLFVFVDYFGKTMEYLEYGALGIVVLAMSGLLRILEKTVARKDEIASISEKIQILYEKIIKLEDTQEKLLKILEDDIYSQSRDTRIKNLRQAIKGD